MKTYFLIVLTAFSLVVSSPVLAQKKKNKFKSGGVVQLNDSLTTYSQSDIFNFPNINKIKFYSQEGTFARLQQLEQSNALQDLYTNLKTYVANFGIENFSTNTSQILKLAQLSQKFGPPGEAVLLYKLVLKHYRKTTDIKNAQTEYDSISTD